MQTKTMKSISSVCALVLVLATQLSLIGCEKLVIYPPGTQTKQINTGTILVCTIQEHTPGGNEPVMFWRAPDGVTVTANSGRVHVERDGPMTHRLYIAHVEAGDAGLYSCESMVNGGMLSADTRLEIFEDITFRDSPDQLDTRVGESPLLECSATGRPQPTISWRFNRHPITSDNVKYQYEARGLRVYNLRTEDAGDYECRAEVGSQGNLKVKSIYLNVEYAPMFTHEPEETLQLIAGQRAEILCQGIGNPDVTYEWFKEQKAGAFAKVKVMLRDEHTDTYVIESPRKEDGGRYYCKISNSLGRKETHTDITVLVPAQVEDIPSEKPLENNVLIMLCNVKGDPEPTIQWERVGSRQAYIEGEQPNDPLIIVDNSRVGVSKLIIHGIQRSYSDQYRCTASNTGGQDAKTANVSVEFSPTINMTDTDKYGWPGEVRNFTCSGYGKPLPALSWLFEGRYISDSSTYKVLTHIGDIVTSTLQITIRDGESWMFGKYSCMVKNIHNHISKVVELREAKVPGFVTNTTVEKDSPTTVKLTVGMPKEETVFPVTSLKVHYEAAKEDDVDEEGHTLYFTLDEDISVGNLHPGVLYTFYISAGNEVGFGDAIMFQVETPEPKEQADIPIPNEIDETPIDRTDSTSKESAKYNGKIKEVKADESADSKPVLSSSAALGIGVTIAVAVIVLIVVSVAIFLRRRSRKQDDYTKTWKGMFSNGRKPTLSDHEGTMVKISENKDIDQIQLEIRRIDGTHPDIIAHASPKPMHVEKCRSPFEIRKNGSVPKLGSPASQGTIDTLQQRAWDQMLITQALQEEEAAPPEVEKNDELTPMMDLPPPPPFLLDNNGSQGLQQPDNISYHDILDGYHSEENIDDRENYEIRLPHSHELNSHQKYC